MKLSIIIPAYNEEKTIAKVLQKVSQLKLRKIIKEIIVVNDGSTDKTKNILQKYPKNKIKIINKKINEGKGAAIRDGLKISSGDIIIIQDADLEYDPGEYPKLLQPILDKKADVVFGSRFVTTQPRRVLYFWHFIGNSLLTLMTNIVTNLNLTDMETCYKAFTKEVAKKLKLSETRFGFEPEFTLQIGKMNCRVYEVGISYSGRSYEEGKKITWKDGLRALWVIFKHVWQQ